MRVLLLSLLFLCACGKSTEPQHVTSIEEVYANAMRAYGPAEQIEKVHFDNPGTTFWHCWYWSQGFQYTIMQRPGQSAVLYYYQSFQPYPYGKYDLGETPWDDDAGTHVDEWTVFANG